MLDKNGDLRIVDRIERAYAPVRTYNLTVAGSRTFFAGGVWVHNCDTMRTLQEAKAAGARIFNNEDWYDTVVKNLVQHHGGNAHEIRKRIHEHKLAEGLGGADNVFVDMTGNVFNPHSGIWIGSLLGK
jgi:hypothetical protein